MIILINLVLLLNQPSCLIDFRSLGAFLYGVCLFFPCLGGFFTFPIISHRPKTHWLETLNCVWVWVNGVCPLIGWWLGTALHLNQWLLGYISAPHHKYDGWHRNEDSLSSVLVYVHELCWHIWLCMMQNTMLFLNKIGRVLLKTKENFNIVTRHIYPVGTEYKLWCPQLPAYLGDNNIRNSWFINKSAVSPISPQLILTKLQK